ncbi:MAG: hypothetical protein LC659_00790 [Myxococcales bacterium]|nr:hypothetical protein [Myxococcales bacterium]
MRKIDRFAAAAAQEEFVAAACAATAHWVPDAEAELHALAAAHLAGATALGARKRRWPKLLATLRATLAAAIGTELGALTWLRRQEQLLIDCYVALEASTTLTPEERLRLRRALVPAAFSRFQRVDRWIMLREEQGAYA